MDIYEKLKEMDVILPVPPPPGGVYEQIKHFGGSLIYTSGVGPTREDGSAVYVGKLGKDLTLEEGQAAARLTMINILGLLHAKLGDLNRIQSFVKQLGFVASSDDFYQHPAVMNSATQLLVDVFGVERGRPARSAIGTNVLPGNIPVEIELVIELKDAD